MVMQYFSRIAHIDLQRRKLPGRSEKKMCVCKEEGDGMRRKNGRSVL